MLRLKMLMHRNRTLQPNNGPVSFKIWTGLMRCDPRSIPIGMWQILNPSDSVTFSQIWIRRICRPVFYRIRMGGGKVRVCEVVKGKVRCKIGCDWSVASGSPRTLPNGNLASLTTATLAKRPAQSSTSRLSGVAVVAQRIRCLLN